MIEIEVSLHGDSRPSQRSESTTYEKLNDGATLLDLLTHLSSKYESLKRVLSHDQGTAQELIVLVNGRNPHNGLLMELSNGDRVSLIPIIAGG